MNQTDSNDLYALEGNDKRLLTKCRACGKIIGNYYAARVAHGRKHVRLREALEHRKPSGHIGFELAN